MVINYRLNELINEKVCYDLKIWDLRQYINNFWKNASKKAQCLMITICFEICDREILFYLCVFLLLLN